MHSPKEGGSSKLSKKVFECKSNFYVNYLEYFLSGFLITFSIPVVNTKLKM